MQFQDVEFGMCPFWNIETLLSNAATFKIKEKLFTLASKIEIESPFFYGDKSFFVNPFLQESNEYFSLINGQNYWENYFGGGSDATLWLWEFLGKSALLKDKNPIPEGEIPFLKRCCTPGTVLE